MGLHAIISGHTIQSGSCLNILKVILKLYIDLRQSNDTGAANSSLRHVAVQG